LLTEFDDLVTLIDIVCKWTHVHTKIRICYNTTCQSLMI